MLLLPKGLLEVSSQDGLTGLFTTHTDPWICRHDPARQGLAVLADLLSTPSQICRVRDIG